MERKLLSFLTWIFVLGGMYAFINGFILLLQKASPSEYGVLGIGGGFWLLSSAIVIYIRSKIKE